MPGPTIWARAFQDTLSDTGSRGDSLSLECPSGVVRRRPAHRLGALQLRRVILAVFTFPACMHDK